MMTFRHSHYTMIKTMFMYFVYGSLGREDGCRCGEPHTVYNLFVLNYPEDLELY